MLFLASRTGWFPVGGLPVGRRRRRDAASSGAAGAGAGAARRRATLERLQSRAMPTRFAIRRSRPRAREACRSTRLVWPHALRLSLTPVLAVYGVMTATLISGSFVVEYVMTWPGLGRLLYDGLIARDANVVAGCAATGAAVLAIGIFVADVALAARRPAGRGSAMTTDPRRRCGTAVGAGRWLALFAPRSDPAQSDPPVHRLRERAADASSPHRRRREVVWPFVQPLTSGRSARTAVRGDRRARCRSGGSTTAC